MISDGDETMTVIATACSNLIRAADGKLLIPDMGTDTGGTRVNQAPPVAEGDLVIYPGNNRYSYWIRPSMLDRDTVAARRMWATAVGHNKHSAVIVDGRYYDHYRFSEKIGWKGFFPIQEMAVVDVQTGIIQRKWQISTEVYGDEPPIWASRGHVYAPSLSMARTDDPSFGDPKPAWWTVIKAGARPYVAGRNPIETTGGALWCEGERMWVRTYFSAICIGYTGEQGRTYENSELIGTVMQAVGEPPKAAEQAQPVKPVAGEPAKPELVQPMAIDDMPERFLCAGPLPKPLAEADRAALLDCAHLVVPGTPFKLPGQEILFRPTPDGALVQNTGENPLTRQTFQFRTMDLFLLGEKPKSGQAIYLLCLMSTPREQSYTLQTDATYARYFVAGQELKPGGRVALAPGLYPMVIEVTLPKLPPFAKNARFRAILKVAGTGAGSLASWRVNAANYRDVLERIAAEDKGLQGTLAKRYLRLLAQEP